MDPNIDHILEPNEHIIWQGYVNRTVITTGFIGMLVVTFIIGGVLFTQDIISVIDAEQSLRVSGPIAGIAILLFGGITSLISFLADLMKQYAITSKRVIIKSGLIGTDFKSVYFDQIKNIIVDVSLIGKLFGVGLLKIDIGKTEVYSTGFSGPTGHEKGGTRTMYDTLKYIDNPYEVYKSLHQMLEGRKESLYSGRADRDSNPEAYKQ